MCNDGEEIHEHLFGKCSFIKEVRSQVIRNYEYNQQCPSLSQEVLRLTSINRKKSLKAKVYIVVWCELVYAILIPTQIIRDILLSCACRFDEVASDFLG